MADDQRIAKLSRFFNQVCHGERALSTSRDGRLFLEALCAQSEPPKCAHKLISSPSGISSLQAAVRFDQSASFMNGEATELLRYFQDPTLKPIGSGSILTRLLLPLVDPPFFWEAFTKSFVSSFLTPQASRAFAWLLLELISLPGKQSKLYVALASSGSPPLVELILKSPDGETRNLGQKIKHALPLDASELHIDAEAKAGGRHDNDHTDYREISIMPTSDELLSKDRPFFRTADFINSLQTGSSRSTLHLDNQFRLLREDMLGEIRDELKVLTGEKSGRHKGITIDGLSVSGLNMGTDKKRLGWGIVLKIPDGLPQLKKMRPDKRKEFLTNNRHILRQGNMACLIVDGEPVAFPTIHRDEDELCKIPATITIQLADDTTLPKALSKMKTSHDIKLIQLDAAIFAYEPFLKRLQGINDLPLREEILHWEEGNIMAGPSFEPLTVINNLEARAGKDIQNLLQLEKSVILDESQMDSLLTGLSQRVSCIQGPPGKIHF